MNEHEATKLLETLGNQVEVNGVNVPDLVGAGRRHLLLRRGAQLVVVAAVATLLPITGRALLTGPSDQAPSTTAPRVQLHKPPAVSGLDPVTEHRLWHIAQGMARANGGTVKVAFAVKSDRHDAELVDGGDLVPGHQQVWLILVEGNKRFVCGDCRGPSSAPQISGWFLTGTFNAKTYDGLDFGMEDQAADLSQLGTVYRLHP